MPNISDLPLCVKKIRKDKKPLKRLTNRETDISVKNERFVAGIDIFGAQAIMNASYFLNLVLLPLSQWSQLVGKPYSDPG